MTVSWKDDAHNLVKASPRSVGEEEEDNVEPGSFFCMFTETSDPFNIGEVLRDEIVPKSVTLPFLLDCFLSPSDLSILLRFFSALEMYAGMAEMSDDEDFEDDDDSEDDEVDLDPRPTKKAKA